MFSNGSCPTGDCRYFQLHGESVDIKSPLLKYQALILGGHEVMLNACQNLNPSTYVSEGEGGPLHLCEEALLAEQTILSEIVSLPRLRV